MPRLTLTVALVAATALPSTAQHTEPLPWYLSLGEASMQLRSRVPVARQVVLVPDLATLIDEVGKWTPQAHWPVLLEEPFFAPMFIRRFNPEAILRRTSIGPLPQDAAAVAAAVSAAAADAWGGSGRAPRAAAAAAGLPVPPGLIVADPSDPALAAALLLAAGRGQDIAWVSGYFGEPDGVLGLDGTTKLIQQVERAAAATGLAWDQLGDAIDTLTVCRSMSARGKTSAAVAITSEADAPMAMTDLLGRTLDGRRWAVAGWIFGDTAKAAWMANCSLFLPRVNAWMCGTYPSQPPWSRWGVAEAAAALEQGSYHVTTVKHETASGLRADTMEGLTTDLAVMTSKGNADFFRMADDTDADPGDVPILDTPAALYMIHSWSLRSPASLDSVGGRWLAHGVYAYVGSSAEPQLQAFVPPSLLAKRIAGGVPFLVASRWWPAGENQMSRPWRVNTLGDPLMIAPKPKGSMRRLTPAITAAHGDGYTDVRSETVTAMQRAEHTPVDAAFAAAISGLVLMGKDDMASQLWAAATAKQCNGPRSARAAFGSLYRKGKHAALLDAWARLEVPTVLEGDMLWSSLGPSLGEGTSDATLSALSEAITPGAVVQRTLRLAPIMGRRYGVGSEIALLDRGLAMATTARQRQVLSNVRKRSGG